MTRRVRVRRAAARDIRSAKVWYEAQWPGLGHQFLRELRATLATLREAPYRHAEIEPGVRRLVMRRFPYVIYFHIVGNEVVVVTVMHQSRLPGLHRTDG